MSAKRSGEKRAIVATLVGAAAVAGIACVALESQTGCQLQNVCAPSSAWWPGPTPSTFENPVAVTLPSSAGIINGGTEWQSGSFDDQWLYFPGGRTYTIFPLMTTDPASPRFWGPYTTFQAYLSTDPNPATTGNFTEGSGNIAEWFLVTDPSASQYAAQSAVDAAAPVPAFNIVNASCAEYYLRIVVTRSLPDDAGVDAGPTVPEDAATDAPSDSSLDAATDAPSDSSLDAGVPDSSLDAGTD